MQAPPLARRVSILAALLFVAVLALALGSAPVTAATDVVQPAAVAAQATPIAPKEATTTTAQINAALLEELPFADQQDIEDAQRGFVATLPEVVIKTEDGKMVWSLAPYAFLEEEEAPPSVNPSLWRMAQLNMNNGLFQVTDRIYQVRGFDLSNMTIVEGDTGLILIDPLSAPETSRAALNLYYEEFGEKPVVAVIYTHSHVDHYGGVKGVIDQDAVDAGEVAVLAPDGFMDAAVSENVFAGNAMTRRSIYQYGLLLPRGVTGQVDNGLGKANPLGEVTLIAPTDIVSVTGETRTIDGVEMEFMMVSGTEAPAEMTIFFPQFNALGAAEIACPLLHNILTLRGAQVRDAKLWATSLDDAIARYGDATEVVFTQPQSTATTPQVYDWSPRNLARGIGQVGKWFGYALRCATLQRDAYTAVVQDGLMTGPALLIGVLTVLLSQLIRIGSFDLLRLGAAVGIWFLAVLLVFATGWLLTRRGNFTQTLRALGFAQSVYFLSVFALYRPTASIVQAAIFALGFLAVWMGAAAAHKTSGWRTLLLPVVVAVVSVVGTAVVAMLLAGVRFTLQTLLAQLGL